MPLALLREYLTSLYITYIYFSLFLIKRQLFMASNLKKQSIIPQEKRIKQISPQKKGMHPGYPGHMPVHMITAKKDYLVLL